MGHNSSSNLDSNRGFGLIPKKRKNRAMLAMGVVNTIVLFVSLVLERSQEASMTCKPIFLWSLSLVGIIFGEFVKRFCLIFEECYHLNTRYYGSKKEMFLACFRDISIKQVLLAGLVTFMIHVSILLNGTKYFKLEYIGIILSCTGTAQLVPLLLGFDTLPRVQLASQLENDNCTVAQGFALSCYYGYLKLILPNLLEKIDKTKWQNKLRIKKLFILLPLDCQIYEKLTDEDKNIEVADDKSIKQYISRGGVSNRPYSNVVYKVKKKNESQEEFFVLAQYEIMLDTIRCMHRERSSMSEGELDEQVKLFYRTLELLLEASGLPDCCRLVPYGRQVGKSLSDILIDAIKKEERSCVVGMNEKSS